MINYPLFNVSDFEGINVALVFAFFNSIIERNWHAISCIYLMVPSP